MIKQIFVVNQDLKMGKGKIAVQVAHGEVFYMEKKYTGHDYGPMYDNYIDWIEDYTMKKVVLKATEAEMIGIIPKLCCMDIWYHKVVDMGFTQVEPNSFTCIVVEPLQEDMCDALFGYFKLL